MTVIQQQHAIDCHLSGSASVVEVLLSFLLEDMNIINAVKNRKPKNNHIISTENNTNYTENAPTISDSTYFDYIIADLTVLTTSKQVQFPSSLRNHNNNIDNFNNIELWSNQEMDQQIFHTILDANAHRLMDAKNCFVQQVRLIVARGIIPQEHRDRNEGRRQLTMLMVFFADGGGKAQLGGTSRTNLGTIFGDCVNCCGTELPDDGKEIGVIPFTFDIGLILRDCKFGAKLSLKVVTTAVIQPRSNCAVSSKTPYYASVVPHQHKLLSFSKTPYAATTDACRASHAFGAPTKTPRLLRPYSTDVGMMISLPLENDAPTLLDAFTDRLISRVDEASTWIDSSGELRDLWYKRRISLEYLVDDGLNIADATAPPPDDAFRADGRHLVSEPISRKVLWIEAIVRWLNYGEQSAIYVVMDCLILDAARHWWPWLFDGDLTSNHSVQNPALFKFQSATATSLSTHMFTMPLVTGSCYKSIVEAVGVMTIAAVSVALLSTKSSTDHYDPVSVWFNIATTYCMHPSKHCDRACYHDGGEMICMQSLILMYRMRVQDLLLCVHGLSSSDAMEVLEVTQLPVTRNIDGVLRIVSTLLIDRNGEPRYCGHAACVDSTICIELIDRINGPPCTIICVKPVCSTARNESMPSALITRMGSNVLNEAADIAECANSVMQQMLLWGELPVPLLSLSNPLINGSCYKSSEEAYTTSLVSPLDPPMFDFRLTDATYHMVATVVDVCHAIGIHIKTPRLRHPYANNAGTLILLLPDGFNVVNVASSFGGSQSRKEIFSNGGTICDDVLLPRKVFVVDDVPTLLDRLIPREDDAAALIDTLTTMFQWREKDYECMIGINASYGFPNNGEIALCINVLNTMYSWGANIVVIPTTYAVTIDDGSPLRITSGYSDNSTTDCGQVFTMDDSLRYQGRQPNHGEQSALLRHEEQHADNDITTGNIAAGMMTIDTDVGVTTFRDLEGTDDRYCNSTVQ